MKDGIVRTKKREELPKRKSVKRKEKEEKERSEEV